MVEQEKQKTGYPHIDRPWLRYYSEEAINAPLPDGSLYDYMTECNKGRLDCVALNYFGTKITHCQFLRRIEECAVEKNAFFYSEAAVGTIASPKGRNERGVVIF